MAIGYALGLRNAQLDAITTFAGAGARLRIYGGTQPTTGGAVTTLLVNDFVLGTVFAPAAASATLSPALPPASTGAVAGTATWFRVVKSDGTTFVMDGSVGTASADLILTTTTIANGSAVAISAWTITKGNA